MPRYKETKRGKKGQKKFYYRTTIYNEVPKRNDDMYFIAQQGDRCDLLANKFYGDSSLWWFIARVNHLKTMHIPTGTSLRIPISVKEAKGK